MKVFILFFLFFWSSSLYAEELYKKSFRHYKDRDFFLALDTIARQYKYQTPNEKVQMYIEKIVKITGSYYFNTYNDVELRKFNVPTTDLIMAKRNLYLRKYFHAHKRLEGIPKGHRFYPEALLVKGTVFTMENNYEKAEKAFKECQDASENFIKDNGQKNKIQRYFNYLKDTCSTNLARNEFEQGNYEKALYWYEKVPKKSYIWPYLLLEKAWAHYHLENYNRTLGILMTYNAPLLESYFMPEAEVLKALSYFKLCLYDDANIIIEKYYSVYKEKSSSLLTVIKNGEKDPFYYFNLMFSPISESEKKNPFIRNLVTQVSKRIKYNLDLNTMYALTAEIKRTKNQKDKAFLLASYKDLKEQMNYFIKVQMYQFINRIHSLSEELFELKLEILSQKRDLIYKNKKLTQEATRGSLENVQKKAHEEFWMFKKAFWADELGDYSFGLKSMCKKKEVL